MIRVRKDEVNISKTTNCMIMIGSCHFTRSLNVTNLRHNKTSSGGREEHDSDALIQSLTTRVIFFHKFFVKC